MCIMVCQRILYSTKMNKLLSHYAVYRSATNYSPMGELHLTAMYTLLNHTDREYLHRYITLVGTTDARCAEIEDDHAKL